MASSILCVPKELPLERWASSAALARGENVANSPPANAMASLRSFEVSEFRLAVEKARKWAKSGVVLTVAFLDTADRDLKKRILAHMNAWNKTANVEFKESKTNPVVRISRVPNDGHWSYVGTDILSIESGQPTMNLDSFDMSTSEAEYKRVVRHETGHTLGFPHEHMRKELVQKIDPDLAKRFYKLTQGWSPAETVRQVLTPIENGSLIGTPNPDPNSIMCYQIPGSITKDRKPIKGGTDIVKSDYDFIATIYPKKNGAGAQSGAKSAKKTATKNAAKSKETPTKKKRIK
jgi:hypothetical protein